MHMANHFVRDADLPSLVFVVSIVCRVARPFGRALALRLIGTHFDLLEKIEHAMGISRYNQGGIFAHASFLSTELYAEYVEC